MKNKGETINNICIAIFFVAVMMQMIHMNAVITIIVRVMLILSAAIHMYYTATLNRRDYEIKHKQWLEIKQAKKDAAFMAEYEQFRREIHGSK